MIVSHTLLVAFASVGTFGSLIPRQSHSSLDDCPGYAASNVEDSGSSVTADLKLAGTACNVYGDDLTDLKLEVEYQTGRNDASFAFRHELTGYIRKPTSRKDIRPSK